MRVNNMTLEQVGRIIANGFVGEHNKQGKQVDYADYQADILKHYWSLSDRKMVKPISQYGIANKSLESANFEVGIQDYVNKSFNKWRDIALNIEMRSM